MALGDLVRSRREQAGLTQEELARTLPGFSRGAVNNLERGATKTISPDVANALVRVLPVTLAELLRATGYELPRTLTKLPDGMLEDLEAAPESVLNAVQLLLRGYRTVLRESRVSDQ